MKKNDREKSFWSNKIGQFRRIAIVTLAFILALSVPAVSNVINSSEDTIVHAQEGNLMIVNETLTKFYVNYNDSDEHWTHNLGNDGEMSAGGPEFDLTDLTYVVKFPEELSHLLEDQYMLDYLQGKVLNFDYTVNPFNITGYVIDESGEQITIVKDTHKPYEHISINKSTNSIEFDFTSFYEENNLEPYIRQNVLGEYFFNNLGFNVPIIVPDSRMLYNGTYEFKTAIVRGKSVDLDDVANAYSILLEVDYSTDPEPEPEVDTSKLEALLAEASSYDADEYTEESYAALTSAVTEAEEVLADEDATQEDVDEAVANIELAIAGLVEVEPEPEDPEVDTSELEALLSKAATYDPDAYTEETYTVLTTAASNALTVLANEDATQEDVDTAVTDLKAALAGLEEIEEEPEQPKEEPKEPEVETEDPKIKETDTKETDDNKESPVNVTDGNDNVLPKTATNQFNWLIGGLIMLMIGSSTLFIRKRKTD